MIRGALGAAAAVALAVVLAGNVAVAEQGPIRLTTKPGVAVKVRNHVKLDGGCAGSAPVIEFSPGPVHGKIEIRPDRFVYQSGYVSGSLLACVGRPVDGVAIWYTPDPGFHGVERFTWTVSFGGGSHSHRMDTHSAQITVE